AEAGERRGHSGKKRVTAVVAADSAGVLTGIQHREGDTVHPGDVLATLDSATAATPVTAVPAAAPEPAPERAHASPVARRMAEQHGVDLSTIQGTGTRGRVTREDVERHVAPVAPDGAPVAPPPPALQPVVARDARGETRIRMTRRRQTIAQRLLDAQRTAPMLP